MGQLLLFNIQNPEKQTAIRLTCMKLGLRWREIPPEQQGKSIETLLAGTEGEETDSDLQAADTFTDEMLLMDGLIQSDFHSLLDNLRLNGQSVRLKAVVTDHNRKWSALRLHRELRAEEEAMNRWKQQNAARKHHKRK